MSVTQREGSLFNVDPGPKTEKEREPKVQSLDQRIWRVNFTESVRGQEEGELGLNGSCGLNFYASGAREVRC